MAHPDKSEFVLKKQIQYLGFILDSVTMKILSQTNRKLKIIKFLQNICSQIKRVLIRDIAKAMGYMVSYLPAVPYWGIHYRQIESENIEAKI